jgi:hypothetical protein
VFLAGGLLLVVWLLSRVEFERPWERWGVRWGRVCRECGKVVVRGDPDAPVTGTICEAHFTPQRSDPSGRVAHA